MPDGKGATKISDLRHKVALCTMRDVITAGGVMELSREAVVWTTTKASCAFAPP